MINRYSCGLCGYHDSAELSKCPSCLINIPLVESAKDPQSYKQPPVRAFELPKSQPKHLSEISSEDLPRHKTGCAGLDKVLGGGFVAGQVVMLAGEPGAGKSTLALSILRHRGGVYISGEESLAQIADRARRINVAEKPGHDIIVLSTNEWDGIEELLQTIKPQIAIIDSIQTIADTNTPGAAGSANQVRAVVAKLLPIAKQRGVIFVVLCQVTKDGDFAGPKNLEHMVDTTLYFEVEELEPLRRLSSRKNRYGAPANALLEMTAAGLADRREIPIGAARS